jgi:hypothetical protein
MSFKITRMIIIIQATPFGGENKETRTRNKKLTKVTSRSEQGHAYKKEETHSRDIEIQETRTSQA